MVWSTHNTIMCDDAKPLMSKYAHGLAESNHQARPNYHELQWHGRWNKNGNTQNKQTNAQPWNKNHLAASDRNFSLNPNVDSDDQSWHYCFSYENSRTGNELFNVYTFFYEILHQYGNYSSTEFSNWNLEAVRNFPVRAKHSFLEAT